MMSVRSGGERLLNTLPADAGFFGRVAVRQRMSGGGEKIVHPPQLRRDQFQLAVDQRPGVQEPESRGDDGGEEENSDASRVEDRPNAPSSGKREPAPRGERGLHPYFSKPGGMI